MNNPAQASPIDVEHRQLIAMLMDQYNASEAATDKNFGFLAFLLLACCQEGELEFDTIRSYVQATYQITFSPQALEEARERIMGMIQTANGRPVKLADEWIVSSEYLWGMLEISTPLSESGEEYGWFGQDPFSYDPVAPSGEAQAQLKRYKEAVLAKLNFFLGGSTDGPNRRGSMGFAFMFMLQELKDYPLLVCLRPRLDAAEKAILSGNLNRPEQFEAFVKSL
jgi:hypothetical protein